MTKAESQGTQLVEQFLNNNLSLELAKSKALEQTILIEKGIQTIKGWETVMRVQLEHLADVKEVINEYQIPLADEL